MIVSETIIFIILEIVILKSSHDIILVLYLRTRSIFSVLSFSKIKLRDSDSASFESFFFIKESYFIKGGSSSILIDFAVSFISKTPSINQVFFIPLYEEILPENPLKYGFRLAFFPSKAF